jgi:hypothetical protein
MKAEEFSDFRCSDYCLFPYCSETEPIQEGGEACIKAHVVCCIGEIMSNIERTIFNALNLAILLIG